MILDRLDKSQLYAALHPGFAAAFEYLRSRDFEALPAGRQEIDGERLFAIIGRDPGRGHDGARLEAHRKYIDIQLCVGGAEEIGWKPLVECREITEPYSAEKDIGFFGDAPESWIALPAATFMIFFPTDAHAPLAGRGDLLKAVAKVAVDWR